MSDQRPPATPREPEIEFLGRFATGGLWLLRRALWLAGACAIAYGVWRSLQTRVDDSFMSALGPVWVTLGLPLVLPTEWAFGRGRRWWLGVSVVLWFAPMLLAGEHAWGFVLRMFATLIAFLSLAVWRTLWRLTHQNDPGA